MTLTSTVVPSSRGPSCACLPPENSILDKVLICNFKTILLNCIGEKVTVVYLTQHFLEAAVVTQIIQPSAKIQIRDVSNAKECLPLYIVCFELSVTLKAEYYNS